MLLQDSADPDSHARDVARWRAVAGVVQGHCSSINTDAIFAGGGAVDYLRSVVLLSLDLTFCRNRTNVCKQEIQQREKYFYGLLFRIVHMLQKLRG